MAGFALVMAVVTYGFVGIVAAGILSLILYRSAKKNRSRRVAVTVAFAPFLALGWLIVSFLLHVEVSNRLAHQDCGFSADPYVTLPNGYILGSHNTYDGYFKAPGFETDVPVAGPGYVRSIVTLHLSNGYFTGTQFDFKTSHVRSFIFNTATREFKASDKDSSSKQQFDSTNAQSLERWGNANTVAQTGSDSYWKLYNEYRHSWPGYVLVLIILVGELGIALWVRGIWAQSDSVSAPQSDSE